MQKRNMRKGMRSNLPWEPLPDRLHSAAHRAPFEGSALGVDTAAARSSTLQSVVPQVQKQPAVLKELLCPSQCRGFRDQCIPLENTICNT